MTMRLLPAMLLVAPASLAAQRTQYDVTLPGAAAAALARVQTVFADSGLVIESTQGTVVVAALSGRPGMGDRVGTRARVRAVVIPRDSAASRVVLTGTIDTPAAGPLPAETIPVTEMNRRAGKMGQRVWKTMGGLAAALGAPAR